MERKVSVPLSCPSAWHPSADVIDMAEELNGTVAPAVISRAKWAHVAHIGPYWSALDQKDSFQQTALHGNKHRSVAGGVCPRSFSLSPAVEHKLEQTQYYDWLPQLLDVLFNPVISAPLLSSYLWRSLILSL